MDTKEYDKLIKEWKKFCNETKSCIYCKYCVHDNCMILWLLDSYYLVSKGGGVLK